MSGRADLAAAEGRARVLFADLGSMRVRRMFGGAGLYLDDAMFAMIAGGEVFLRTNDALARDLEAAGSSPFVWQGRSGPVTRPFWRLPAEARDDPARAVAWAQRALAPAREAAAAKRARAARKAARA